MKNNIAREMIDNVLQPEMNVLILTENSIWIKKSPKAKIFLRVRWQFRCKIMFPVYVLALSILHVFILFVRIESGEEKNFK